MFFVLFYCRASEDAETSGFSFAVRSCGPKEKGAADGLQCGSFRKWLTFVNIFGIKFNLPQKGGLFALHSYDPWCSFLRRPCQGSHRIGLIYGKRDVKNISLRPLSPCGETFEKRPFLTIHEQQSCRNMTAKKDGK